MSLSIKLLVKTITYTVLALIAFAANSVLCRLALGENTIDASGFTSIRLVSGALVLAIIFSLKRKINAPSVKGNWLGASMLFIYALTFSFAYLTLDTGTGALILFGSVQITMILSSMISGNRLHIAEWIGVVLAFAGFVYLVLPNITMPSFSGFFLMTLAGIAWGIYTLAGRASQNPLSDTSFNFLRSVVFVFILVLFTFHRIHLSTGGILLAVLSGGIMSGLGYTIWYTALGGLSVTQAAVVQLSVPVIAALGGVLFVNETIGLRLTISGVMILGGILIVIARDYSITDSSLPQARGTRSE